MSRSKNKTGKRIGMVAGIFLGVLVVSVVAFVLLLVHYINKVNYVPLKEEYTILAETESFYEDVTNPYDETLPDSSKDEIDEYQKEVEALIAARGETLPELEDVYNVLLIGTDERIPGESSRSDTMLLISINKKTKQIVGTSFLRDLYVKIPGRDFDKLNAAHAFGGVELLLDTLEYNFSLHVDRYITVNFQSFIKVVDIIGGLDINVYEDDLYWLNEYIHASNLIVGDEEHSDYLDYADGSVQHLNGKQSLAYARFRFVGNGDFSRTERQRRVVKEVFEKLKKTDPATLIELLDTILPEVTTNIPTNEFLELICMIPEMSGYDIVSWSIANGDTGFKYITIDKVSHVAIDMNKYIRLLFDVIYTGKSPTEAETLPDN
ncbi:MAG: LCP family protein [Butyrivibrio sp.]